MKHWRTLLKEYILIFFGIVITALSLDWFLVPNKIAAGGVSGLATVAYHLVGIPVGLTMLAINIPLFFITVRLLGPKFGVKTVFGTVSLSVIVDLLQVYVQPLTTDPLLSAIYGGAMAGVGMGIALKYGGSTGGTDLAALIINYLLKTGVGRALLMIDAGVILLAGVAFNPELALYALLALYLTSKAIDLIQEGFTVAKGAYIISEHPEEIGQEILHKMGRGVTVLSGKGMYTDRERPVLFVVVSRRELSRLKDIVRSHDPKAFVVIHDVHEVLGEGFKTMSTTPD